jgi:hypothetical protein
VSGTAGLTKEYLNELFEYKDGNLHWKKYRSSNAQIGSKSGSVDAEGYIVTSLNGNRYKNHRLIFLYHHGYLPKQVDHINGNKSDNRIDNLRPATNQKNQFNVGLRSTNKSGIKNVSWCKPEKKWKVGICFNGKKIHFGYYDNIELAELVAIEARDKYHKEFARHK